MWYTNKTEKPQVVRVVPHVELRLLQQAATFPHAPHKTNGKAHTQTHTIQSRSKKKKFQAVSEREACMRAPVWAGNPSPLLQTCSFIPTPTYTEACIRRKSVCNKNVSCEHVWVIHQCNTICINGLHDKNHTVCKPHTHTYTRTPLRMTDQCW